MKLKRVEGRENVGRVYEGSPMEPPAVGRGFRFVVRNPNAPQPDGVVITSPVREITRKTEDRTIIRTQNSVYSLED